MTKLLSNRATRLCGCLGGAMLLSLQISFAQDPSAPVVPIDDITNREVMSDRVVLPYQPLREADILWERRIWREIDVREKMNLPFAAPELPFFKILTDAAFSGELAVYSTEDDKFKKRLSKDELLAMLYKQDTIITEDVESYEETVKIVQNEVNWEEVKRFRIKESWFFDTRTSTLQHRILGIAPVIDVRDNEGNFRFEMPMFWVYYPQARPLLARNKVLTHGENMSANTSWEDIFEKRYFASFITKENNVKDLRLKDVYSGVDLLMESDKIKNELFSTEHDMWAY